MAYVPPNANGQATMANSSPVVIASNQSTLNVSVGNLPTVSDSLACSTYDGLANPINSLAAGTGENGLMVAIGATNYVASTLNSSTTQLAANGTFTGTIENAFNEPSISLLLTSDQPILLTLYQYIDSGGVYAAPPISFTILAGKEFSRSFVINGNYLKVTAQNIGTLTTTTFNLNTAYGTIPSSDASGNVPSAIYGADGNQVTTDNYNGIYFLHVDPSTAGTDGTTYNSTNFPQVNATAGKGLDGNAHAISVDNNGTVQVGGSVLSNTIADLLGQILVELRTLNRQTNIGLSVQDDLDQLRTDAAFENSINSPLN